MSSGLPSDEVAEDYKNSLEDLTTNDKFQISNLTVIAKENTEHAMAISRVLENHIRTTPPAQKLPALYVVDSVVKNVGTPYTLFLGRNLYQTFMNAYTLVDQQTRRKLDEMLKTWKEPVPGSLDPRPVFPVDVTRSIENALIKARTAALQQQQARGPPDVLGRGRGTATPPGWTHTPTPPQTAPSRFPAPYGSNGQALPQAPAAEPYPSRYSQTPQQFPPAPSPTQEVDISVLHRDIEGLIMTARSEFANNPLDFAVQQRLKALLDLQGILQRQELPQEQLKLVRDQVSALAPTSGPQLSSLPPSLPALLNTAGPSPSVSTPPSHSIPPATPQPNLQGLLNSSTLAGLIKATANRQQPTPPPAVANILSQVQSASTPQSASATPVASENPLIASLRARGLLPSATGTPPAVPGQPSLPFIIPGQVQYTPPVATPQAPPSTEITINVHMSTPSIKIPRPVLINSLYDAKNNKCGTCGRRFSNSEEGKQRKARHLDWHFKTNQRMVDATRRGQSRSWYVDERDWIKSREYDDDSGLAGGVGPGGSSAVADEDAAKNKPQTQWIRAPNDAALRNAPCPICQEKFESTWSEDVQDWIWQDAVKVGNRVYHASCYAEVTKDGPPVVRGGTPSGRTGTPDSVLGKRKAEDTDSPSSKVRVKTEALS